MTTIKTFEDLYNFAKAQCQKNSGKAFIRLKENDRLRMNCFDFGSRVNVHIVVHDPICEDPYEFSVYFDSKDSFVTDSTKKAIQGTEVINNLAFYENQYLMESDYGRRILNSTCEFITNLLNADDEHITGIGLWDRFGGPFAL